MAIPMPIVQDIRKKTRPAGNVARADSASRLHVDRRDGREVRGYGGLLAQAEGRTSHGTGRRFDPYAHLVDGWLEADRDAAQGAAAHDQARARPSAGGDGLRRRVFDHDALRAPVAPGGPAACRIARGTCGSSGRRAACRSISAWPGPGSLARWRTCIAWWSRCRIRTCGCAWRCRARTRSVCAMA